MSRLKVRVHPYSRFVHWLLPANVKAVTVGRHIFCRGMPSFATLSHEAAHVCQFVRYGLVGFYARWIWYQVTVGYAWNPLEMEARRSVLDAGLSHQKISP